MIKESFKRIIPPLVCWKAMIFLAVVVAWRFHPSFFDVGMFHQNLHWPLYNYDGSFWWRFLTWDSSHYLLIAEKGYKAHNLSAAFCPLYPGLIKLFSFTTGGNLFAAGLLISNLCSLAAVVIFHAEVVRKYDKKIADWAVLLWMTYPGSLYLSLIYTEALFVFIAVLFFAALERKNWLFAAGVSLLAPMTRHIGIFLTVPFLLALFKGKAKWHEWSFSVFPIFGYGLNMLILYMFTGDFFVGFKAQQGMLFGQNFLRILDVPGFVDTLFTVHHIHGYTYSFTDRVLFAVFAVLAGLLLRKNLIEFAYAVLFTWVPAMTGYFSGMIRYPVVLFPVFSAFAADALKSRFMASWILPGVTVVMAIAQVILLIMHSHWKWVA